MGVGGAVDEWRVMRGKEGLKKEDGRGLRGCGKVGVG